MDVAAGRRWTPASEVLSAGRGTRTAVPVVREVPSGRHPVRTWCSQGHDGVHADRYRDRGDDDSPMLGLGVRMAVRHGTAGIAGLPVWGFFVENLLTAFPRRRGRPVDTPVAPAA